MSQYPDFALFKMFKFEDIGFLDETPLNFKAELCQLFIHK